MDFLAGCGEPLAKFPHAVRDASGSQSDGSHDMKDPHPVIVSFLDIQKGPSARQSISLRRKQAMASWGRQTIGSCSLKEVFNKTGTPDFCSKLLIRSQ